MLVPVECVLVMLGWAISRKAVRFIEANDDALEVNLLIKGPMPGWVWFASHLGWLLFLIPVSWGLFATLRAEASGKIAYLRTSDAYVGWMLAVLLVMVVGWEMIRSIGWVWGPAHGPLFQLG
jgi:hypothetical protein